MCQLLVVWSDKRITGEGFVFLFEMFHSSTRSLNNLQTISKIRGTVGDIKDNAFFWPTYGAVHVHMLCLSIWINILVKSWYFYTDILLVTLICFIS